MAYITTEVDVDLSDFNTSDLLDELESRGVMLDDLPEVPKELLEKIWMKRRMGNTDYQTELDKLIYTVLGKIV
jgi:hypothetical protein